MVFLHPMLKLSCLFGPFLLFILSLLNERMFQQVGPPQPLGRVFAEQPFEKVLEVTCYCFWIYDWVFADVVYK